MSARRNIKAQKSIGYPYLFGFAAVYVYMKSLVLGKRGENKLFLVIFRICRYIAV